MPAPSIEDLCKDIAIDLELAGGLSLLLPGGAELSVTLPTLDIMNAGDLAKQLMASANAALAPLMPLFNILDVVLLLFKVVKAIPGSLGPPPDPSKLIKLLGELTAKVDKLLAIIPPLSIPITIKGLITVLVTFLKGLKAQLSAVLSIQLENDAAAARADALMLTLPSVAAQLSIAVGCAKATADATIAGMGQGTAPVNRLIGLLNLLCGLAGLPEIPTLTELGGDAQVAIDGIDIAIKGLEVVRLAIP